MRTPWTEYDPPPSHDTFVVPALIWGIISGPIAIALAAWLSRNLGTEAAKERVFLGVLLLVLGSSLVFACVAHAKLPANAPLRASLIGKLAIAAPIAWLLLVFGCMQFAGA